MGCEGRSRRGGADQARGERRARRRDRAPLGADALRALALLAASLALAGCAASGGGGGDAARVDSVRDGDTILLTDGVRVRLVQIDAPELGSECYGDAALGELELLVRRGEELRLEADPALDSVDRLGRLLRYVYVDGTNVNLELVRRGAAAPYFFGGERGRHAAALATAANRARAAGLGLWGACPGTPLEPGRAVAAGPP